MEKLEEIERKTNSIDQKVSLLDKRMTKIESSFEKSVKVKRKDTEKELN